MARRYVLNVRACAPCADFSSAADAFSSIAIVSALMFGFALSSFVSLVGVDEKYLATDATLPIGTQQIGSESTAKPMVAVWAIIMVVTAGLSGYATIFMTVRHAAACIAPEH